MYQDLAAKGKLPASDADPLSFDQHCLVGVTKPLDSSVHEILKREQCDFEIVIPKTDPFYVSLVFGSIVTPTVAGKTMNIKLIQFLVLFSPSTWISQAIASVGQ